MHVLVEIAVQVFQASGPGIFSSRGGVEVWPRVGTVRGLRLCRYSKVSSIAANGGSLRHCIYQFVSYVSIVGSDLVHIYRLAQRR